MKLEFLMIVCELNVWKDKMFKTLHQVLILYKRLCKRCYYRNNYYIVNFDVQNKPLHLWRTNFLEIV